MTKRLRTSRLRGAAQCGTPHLSWTERLRDARWQAKAAEIRDAAGYRCEDCGRQKGDGRFVFEVHHCAYILGAEPWDHPNSLLKCLCPECHEFRQDRENAFRVALGEVTAELKPAQLDEEVWRILQDIRLRETARLAASFGGEQ